MSKHTPTPWRVTEHERNDESIALCIHSDAMGMPICRLGGNISQINVEANAEFIVRAVNSHDKLVEAAERLLATLDAHLKTPHLERLNSQMGQFRAALAMAKGE
jgi:hypothetical protein